MRVGNRSQSTSSVMYWDLVSSGANSRQRSSTGDEYFWMQSSAIWLRSDSKIGSHTDLGHVVMISVIA